MGGEGGEGWHGHPGPRAEQMSATTCFLTPVRVLVSPRMQPAEKFMTLEVSCPPSKTAALPPLIPPSLPLLLFSLLHATAARSAIYTHLQLDSSDSYFDQVKFELQSLKSHARLTVGQARESRKKRKSNL